MRICAECGAILISQNAGLLCFPCQEKRQEKMSAGARPYYDVNEMAQMMGLESAEQILRLGRKGLIPGRIPLVKEHRYNREVIDEWIKSGGLPLHRPTSPLQQEAYQECVKKDHRWLSDDRFNGMAYGTETADEPGEYTIHIKSKRTCYFCGHFEIIESP